MTIPDFNADSAITSLPNLNAKFMRYAYSNVDNLAGTFAYDDSDITNPYSNLYKANEQYLTLMYEESDTSDNFDSLINLLEKG